MIGRAPRAAEEGAALLLALAITMLVSALGTALVLLTMTETLIASNFRDGLEIFYAADAALARVLPELAAAPDWDAVLAGAAPSSLVDGAAGVRDLGGGVQLDLVEASNTIRCGLRTACSEAAMNAATAERPWGHNNPHWQLFAHGPASELIGVAGAGRRLYVVVWVGDDPLEVDADPLHDGALPSTPGHGRLTLRAHAYGPDGSRRALEATVAREPWGLRFVTWHEVR